MKNWFITIVFGAVASLLLTLPSCGDSRDSGLSTEKAELDAENKALLADIDRAQRSHDNSQLKIIHERNVALQKKTADWMNKARAAGWTEK